QFGGAYVFQSEPFDELCRGRREPALIARRAVVLLLRSLLLHGKRNKLTVDSAIAGLSFCSGLLLDWPTDLARRFGPLTRTLTWDSRARRRSDRIIRRMS